MLWSRDSYMHATHNCHKRIIYCTYFSLLSHSLVKTEEADDLSSFHVLIHKKSDTDVIGGIRVELAWHLEKELCPKERFK